MKNLTGFNKFNEDKKDILAAEKVVLGTHIKKSVWLQGQKPAIKELIKRIAGTEVKVIEKRPGNDDMYKIKAGDLEIEVPGSFLLA